MQSQDNQPPGNSDATLVAPRTQQGSARLILRRPDGQLTEYGMDKDEISIGRLATNDVVLNDDRSVSRRHAVIRRSNVGYVIEDQQSNNGTYVDGEKILYPFVLHNNQSIKIGSNELTFKLVSAPLPAPAPAEPAPARTNPTLPRAEPQPQSFGSATLEPAPQMGFPLPPPPGFDIQQPAPPVAQPQPAFPPQPAAFQQPEAAPAFPAQPQPVYPAPAFPAQPAPLPGAPGQQQAVAGPGEIICQQCNNPTLANKQFCLQCGASIVAQVAQSQAASSGPAAPFGSQPMMAPGFPPNQPGTSYGQPQQPLGQPQPGWPPQQPGQFPPNQFAGPQQAPGQMPPGQSGWPPQQPAGQPQPGQPQGWPPQQPGQMPPNQMGGPQPQGWPGQPGQFGAPAPAPAAGPIDATAFYPRGMRPLQTVELRVRLATQFAAPGPIQPGAAITVRIWPAAQDAFYLSGPGVTLRVPGPGGVEEGTLQVTPLRPTAPGATDQLLLMITDANSGQPLQPTPVAAEIVIAYQPTPPFDGPGSVRILG